MGACAGSAEKARVSGLSGEKGQQTQSSDLRKVENQVKQH